MPAFFHIYTGDGKGKTTCAFGLAIRYAGWKKKVLIVKLLKNKLSGEDIFLKNNSKITIKMFGSEKFVFSKPGKKDIVEINSAMQYIKKILNSKKHVDLLIIDEICVAMYFGLISISQAKEIISLCNKKDIELVFTGRKADPKIVKLADIVTEMRQIKHYYNAGISARKGTEY